MVLPCTPPPPPPTPPSHPLLLGEVGRVKLDLSRLRLVTLHLQTLPVAITVVLGWGWDGVQGTCLPSLPLTPCDPLARRLQTWKDLGKRPGYQT